MFKICLPRFIFRIERWKWNKEYRVYVSNMGHFRDEHKRNLSVKIGSGGYCLVKTFCGNIYAHRLVLFTWRPIPNAEAMTVDHLNHNKRDNCLENLEWVTYKENQRRAVADYIPFNEDYNTEIECINKNKIFKNEMEAAEWLLNDGGNGGLDLLSKEYIAAKIKLRASSGKGYAGYRWKFVNPGVSQRQTACFGSMQLEVRILSLGPHKRRNINVSKNRNNNALFLFQ